LTFDTPFDVKSEKIADASRFPFFTDVLPLLLAAVADSDQLDLETSRCCLNITIS
jgi:hypothetical protein